MAHSASEHDDKENKILLSSQKLSSSDRDLEPGLLAPDNAHLVTWSGPNDLSNPLNWSRAKKWTATFLVSCFTFISPVSSTMVAPALDSMAFDLKVTSETEQYLMMSIFLLAYALGPFIIAPLSEMYGRVVILQSANMFYLVFNIVCGFATSPGQMFAFRFLSGFGGSAPQAIGGGVLSDCWRKEERGAATALYSLMPFLGPAIGPIAGGYLTQYMSWRWIFWIVSIADAVVQVLAFCFLSETYAPTILATKRRKLQKETGNDKLHTEYDSPDRTFGQELRKNLVRPLRMLFTQPAIQALALYRGYQYGLMYLVLASFPMVWEVVYREDTGTASLNYLSLGIGFVLGLQFCGRVLDMIYMRLKRHYKHDGRPEFRVPLMVPGGLLVPLGLFIYGWTAQNKTHWIVPNVGAAIFAFGLIISFQCAQTYVVDAYSRYAASATGAAAFVRTIAGFAFPLFADSLYKSLGLGWGNSLLGFVSLGLGIMAPVLLWFYGEWLRAKSTYCAG
ncbi:MFS general substrate transporter [Penicillium canescens]|uniref:MFS general substrate transporter n=1 Tax=Penicillium canescens TaxID=5083 RepID=A0AAD6NC89_PENCN|nr:MFS general substrate transporter [Penicillium canescens]KAJ5990223.1 MFS general substrate transporter [Penicillium canescens]KAJ6051386.1 MFS general substrate transporter [Penicillium canescens]KAJ6061898.1 MFS general substrate transporter [Penicillium canescens]KAJ6068863.1 MFS general substrate transporter [Penicillium canescens]KAJ6183081.1 MFS general substrate transporter [Penicillium canescens]